MNSLNSNELYSINMLKKACLSTISLWNSEDKSFIRSTNSYKGFYPTATIHGISALNDSDILTSNFTNGKFEIPKHFENNYLSNENKKRLNEIGKCLSNIFDKNSLKKCLEHKTVNKIHEKIDNKIIKSIIKDDKTNWIDLFLLNSTHSKDSIYKDKKVIYTTRILISLERLLYVIGINESFKKKIDDEFIERIKTLIYDVIRIDNENLYPEVGKSPLPILNLVLTLNHLKLISSSTAEEFSNEILKLLNEAEKHINYHMARFDGMNEPSFDPVSLATALYAATILKPKFKFTSFFNSCLKVIIDRQTSNGCWPAGVSISFSENADVVQLPSVEIAMFIAEAVVDEDILINANENITQSLNIILPAFRKFAKYLELTYQDVVIDGIKKIYNGWGSDRIGSSRYIETWISSEANRFLYRLWIAEKALSRNIALKQFGLSNFQKSDNTVEELREKWDTKIVETSSIVRPKEKVNEFVVPIVEQMQKHSFISYPIKEKVSFIIFGPPGSGKTYFINKMANYINWPLIELSPGHFIKKGVELIESTTKEIFDVLYDINHVIVFFDECDELFRSRKDSQSATRTILSFATASMLPKLQKLHDKGQIIFILGTNYLQNIDNAVKRPGRFDDIIFYDRPDYEGRLNFIRTKLKEDGRKAKEKTITDYAKKTNGFSVSEVVKFLQQRNDLNDTVQEYLDWCFSKGEEELKNSRLTEETKNKIISNWKELRDMSLSKKVCEFCDEIKKRNIGIFYKIYGEIIKSRIIYKDENFVVIPTLGQMFKYSLLILPICHIETLSELKDSQMDALKHLYEKIKEILSKFGNVIAFEHGSKISACGGCGIYHAHLHMIAVPEKIEMKNFIKHEFTYKKNIKESLKALNETCHYLLAIDHDGSCVTLNIENLAEYYPSQYFRRRLHDYFKIKSAWDWRKYDQPEEWLLSSIYDLKIQ